VEQIEKLKEYIYPNGIYSNIRSNSALIRKYFPLIYEKIKDDYKTNLYMLLHDIKEIPKCKNPTCNNKVKLKNISKGFRKFCCNKCIAKYQKTDKEFGDKISKTHKEKNKEHFKNKYPDLNVVTGKTIYILKNYCIHGDIKIKTSIFNRLYADKKCLCKQCNEDLINNYIPSKEDINLFLDNFNVFYKRHSLAFKDSWFLEHYPKEYKIILEWTKHIKNISLSERICFFKNKLKDYPKCKNPKCNKKTHFKPSQNNFTIFCNSYACQRNTSTQEIEIFEFLKTYESSTQFKYFIDKKEYDLLVKDKNLLIEHNGLIWHGDTNILENKKDITNYHYNRYVLAKNNGFDLFNIWGDEWKFKKDIIKSMLLSKIDVYKEKIDIINCVIKEINNTKQFLNNTHIEGWCKSSKNIGLFYNDKLVSLMTFKKINDNYELLRFCNILYADIKNASAELFQYFINTYKVKKILSYSSCDYPNLNLYKLLGFKELGHTGINYWWCNNIHRFNCNKFDKNKLNKLNEESIRQLGYYKIWNSGHLKFEWQK